jgi:hypothetical protein
METSAERVDWFKALRETAAGIAGQRLPPVFIDHEVES